MQMLAFLRSLVQRAPKLILGFLCYEHKQDVINSDSQGKPLPKFQTDPHDCKNTNSSSTTVLKKNTRLAIQIVKNNT